MSVRFLVGLAAAVTLATTTAALAQQPRTVDIANRSAARLASCCAVLLAQQPRTVDIANMVEIPQLVEVKDGLLEGLKTMGFEDGKNLKVEYRQAQGNLSTVGQIIRRYVGEQPNVIVTLTTPVAQAAVTATHDIPVVFLVVTDPVGSRVVPRFDKPGSNVTGVSDLAPIERQIDLVREMAPNVRRLGTIYNPGLDGSLYQLTILKKLLGPLNLTLVEAPSPSSNDAINAMRSLVGRVDAVWIPNDPTVYSALEAVVRVAQEQKIPLFTAEARSVERGAAASIGFDYHAVGIEGAKLVAAILKGEKPGDLDVVIPNAFRLVVNRKSATAMGIEVPQAVLQRATQVID